MMIDIMIVIKKSLRLFNGFNNEWMKILIIVDNSICAHEHCKFCKKLIKTGNK